MEKTKSVNSVKEVVAKRWDFFGNVRIIVCKTLQKETSGVIVRFKKNYCKKTSDI